MATIYAASVLDNSWLLLRAAAVSAHSVVSTLVGLHHPVGPACPAISDTGTVNICALAIALAERALWRPLLSTYHQIGHRFGLVRGVASCYTIADISLEATACCP